MHIHISGRRIPNLGVGPRTKVKDEGVGGVDWDPPMNQGWYRGYRTRGGSLGPILAIVSGDTELTA
jgi:hypothetical protein